MDKRYQVFVSSTYTDLRDERACVTQMLMELDCIPATMELFPSADQAQWEFLKQVLADCDYYLLLIGGRYGTLAPDGLSYTEKEYDYAVEIGLKVVALLHGNPDAISVGKTEREPAMQKRLAAFREKVARGRLIRTWEKIEELPGLVAQGMAWTMKRYPAVGWVRANRAATADVLEEINDLRKRNEGLQAEVTQLRTQLGELHIPDLADSSDETLLEGAAMEQVGTVGLNPSRWQRSASWDEIFSVIAPDLLAGADDDSVSRAIANCFSGVAGNSKTLTKESMRRVAVQLAALQLVDIQPGGVWKLTTRGKAKLFSDKAARKKLQPPRRPESHE